MSFWTALVAIVAIGACAMVLRGLISGQKAQEPGGNPPGAATIREEQLQREVADLKKRLAVLERIATDDRQSKAIANEIESLRDS